MNKPEKDSIIVCWECGKDIYRFRGAKDWEMISAAQFEPLEGIPAPRDGELVACPKCGKLLIRGEEFKIKES
ncbi:MAG: hypothetical protein ACTSW1_08455 [Candidatus Hodarchaeales archaeon]